jgi:hypothetical protein
VCDVDPLGVSEAGRVVARDVWVVGLKEQSPREVDLRLCGVDLDVEN